jgi:hypothetical protein
MSSTTRARGESHPLEIDREDARAAGRADRPYDVLIAGQTRARGLTLVTNNLSEFKCVDGLEIDDWTQPYSSQERKRKSSMPARRLALEVLADAIQ